MSFTTALFWIFILIGVVIYYILPSKVRWVWLLVLSYLYYFSFNVKNSLFMVAASLVIYLAALAMERIQDRSDVYLKEHKAEIDREQKKKLKNSVKHKKRIILVIAMLINFGVLAVLKYGGFITGNITAVLNKIGIDKTVYALSNYVMPLGLSFFTFQSISYVIDIYQGKYRAEKNPFKICLFVSFFPQIMQGPIGRFDKLGKTLFAGNSFNLQNIQFGIQRIFWGLFKKMILADRAGVFVAMIFNKPDEYGGAMAIIAVLMYSIQLYADFSGGIDIVIGVAQLFGVTMDENFRQPYFSKSIGEFWRRWHITLGTWMKDYVFYPFCLSKAMNKFGKWGKKHLGDHVGKTLPICLSNLLIFFIVGIWHGAEWRYIMYGMYNGVIIAFSNLVEPLYKKCLHACHINPHKKWWQCVQILRTFILVNIGWVFDCSVAGMGSAIRMIKRMITDLRFDQLNAAMFKNIGLTSVDYIFLLAGCVVVLIISVLKERGVQIRVAVAAKPIVVRWLIYYGIILAIFVMGYASNAGSGFLYANF